MSRSEACVRGREYILGSAFCLGGAGLRCRRGECGEGDPSQSEVAFLVIRPSGGRGKENKATKRVSLRSHWQFCFLKKGNCMVHTIEEE